MIHASGISFLLMLITLHYIQVIQSGLKSKTAKPLNSVSVHGVSVTMRTNEKKDKF